MNTPLANKLLKALLVLRAYEQWEADLIKDGSCWEGSHPVIKEKHYQRLLELQEMRNHVLEEETEAQIVILNGHCRACGDPLRSEDDGILVGGQQYCDAECYQHIAIKPNPERDRDTTGTQ